jgi:hypothetical protein
MYTVTWLDGEAKTAVNLQSNQLKGKASRHQESEE